MVKNTLRDKILGTSKLLDASILSDSLLFSEREVMVNTPVPLINIALSGKVNGGLLPGVLMIAGPSKHFKTAFGLLMVSSFLNKYSDGVVIFYDSEFGSPETYFHMFGIDPTRIVHLPITNIEEWKTDIATQIKNLTSDDRVMIFADSVGNLASLKEVEDAEEGKVVADMTRAKQLKSVFRIIRPHLVMKNIPMVVINHTYKEIGMYPKDIVSGGTGAYLNSDDIWLVGRQQDKDKDTSEINGFNFVINIEKSRLVKEKSKFIVNVSFDRGIAKYSGLFELAMEAGLIESGSKGWYNWKGDAGRMRRSEIDVSKTMEQLLQDQSFLDYVEKQYCIGITPMVAMDA